MSASTSRVQEEAMRVLLNRLQPIVSFLEDESVTEIMINTAERIFIERDGKIAAADVQLMPMSVEAAIRAIMTINSKDTSYIMDARLPGLRIACAMPPVSVHGPMITIRKHRESLLSLSDYLAAGFLDKGAERSVSRRDEAVKFESEAAPGGRGLAAFLQWAVRARKNVLIAGGTGSGKTTLLTSLLREIPPEERVITCEDTNEITLEQPDVVQLEALNAPGKVSTTIRDLIRLCLRCRPDRIIVGEIRGKEAYDFLDALNTGHSGSLCTLHADSAFLALRRLESLIRMSDTAANLPLTDMRFAIASALDYVLYQEREGGVRAPQQVIAIDGVKAGDYTWHAVYSRYDA